MIKLDAQEVSHNYIQKKLHHKVVEFAFKSKKDDRIKIFKSNKFYINKDPRTKMYSMPKFGLSTDAKFYEINDNTFVAVSEFGETIFRLEGDEQ